ncbi:hypothetical protein QFZ75_007781 [Streptomyces sp. V3I8]|nr:hypothetical protein [Streptomyces sp. V3I8]
MDPGNGATLEASYDGLTARLNYLTCTAHALEAARAAGLTVTGRTLRAWQAGTRTLLRKNLAAIEQAYRTVRWESVARYLLARLNRQGRGTRVEVHPVNQSRVDWPRQCAVELRHLNMRNWDRIVGA